MHLVAALLLLLGATQLLPAQETITTKRRTPVGAFYHPHPGKDGDLRRMINGNPGGPQAFSMALAPVVRGEREVWKGYLEMARRVGAGRFRVVLDLHVLARTEWTEGNRLKELLQRILDSPGADSIAGFYVCDEPFGRSRPGAKNPVDIARIWDIVKAVRRAGRGRSRPPLVFADYAAVFPLLRKGGDLVNGGMKDATSRHEERERFLWNGKFVTSAATSGGKRLRRRYGAFGEDRVLVNWWEGPESLDRWLPLILKDIPAKKLMLTVGYDWGARTPEADRAHLLRTRKVIRRAQAAGIGGYWFWPWQDIPAQGRIYKGASGWWEDGPDGERRYAALIESIR